MEGPLGLIAHHLAQSPDLEACRDVFSLYRTSKTLKAAAASQPPAKQHLMRVPMVGKAQQLVRLFLSGHPKVEESRLCLPVLRLLNPAQQARLVRIQLDPASYQLHDRDGPPKAFKVFVPHLAHLDEPLRAELATRACSYESDEAAAKAIGGLGGGLVHFDEPSIERLVNKAARLQAPKWRAHAIRRLSAGWALMTTGQRQDMWQAAMSLQDPQYQEQAIAGLYAEMKHMPPEQRKLLFDRAINLPPSQQRAKALAGLAASLEVLDERQTETLLAEALSLPHDNIMGHKEAVVCALAARVEHLDPGQSRRLADAILELRSARAMAALGPGFERMATDRQDQLLEVLAELEDEQKTVAITGLAAAWPSLAPARRARMADLVLGMDALAHMAEAIGALGPHLKHLEEDLHDAVVERAVHLLGDEAARGAITQGPVRALATGMAAGMEALRQDQRDALVGAVAAIDPHRSRTKRDFGNLHAIAAAIAGLACGQQHLSEPQFETLIKTARSLELDVALVEGQHMVHLSSPDAIKATAYFGLAMG